MKIDFNNSSAGTKLFMVLPFSSFQSVVRTLLTVILILLVHASFAQNDKPDVSIIGDSTLYKSGRIVILTGTIRSSLDKAPIVGVALFVNGTKIGNNTDGKGLYQISLPNGKHKISVRYLGMKPLLKEVAVYTNGVLDLEMEERIQSLDEVIVRAKKDDYNVRESLGGVTTMSTKELKNLPALLGETDIIKSIQLLPGITSVGEGTSSFNVRGGRVDQNLVTLDGAQIFNSSHLLGFFSAFNPDVTEGFTLYKGSVPAQFGGRLSSVLDVSTRNGDFQKTNFRGGVGPTSARLAVDGPIFKDRTSFLVGARFSYSDYLLRMINNVDVKQSSASFYDLNAAISHRINKHNIISLSGYNSSDYLLYSTEFGYRYDTRLATLKWNSAISTQLTSHFSLSYGNYKSSYFKPTGADGMNTENGITYLQMKENLSWSPSDKHELNFGFEINQYKSQPEKSTPYGETSAVASTVYARNRGREVSIFINDEFEISDRFSVSAGLRYTLYQNFGSARVIGYRSDTIRSEASITDTLYYGSGKVIKTYDGLEPRVSGRFSLTPQSSIKFGYNRMKQYISLISNTTAPTPVDLWQVSTSYIRPQRADNFSVGYYRNFKDNTFETYLEGFYKKSSNLVEYKDFARLLQNDHLETELVQGRGKSYGAELFLRKAKGDWTGWIAYTYSRSFVKVEQSLTQESVNQGRWYPSNYDKPHAVSFVANRKIGSNSAFGCNIVYATGRPISSIISNYQAGGTVVPVFSNRNEYRIPDYIRIDVSLTIGDIFKKVKDDLTISIYNLLARKNAYSVYYQRLSALPLPQSYKLSLIGTALPSITYNISF